MKYYLWILGCAMNYSDAERLASVLESLGYSRTENESGADLIVVLACSVRQKAIDKIYGKTKAWVKLKLVNRNLKLIITGCVLEKDKPKMRETFDAIIPIGNINELPLLLVSLRGAEGDAAISKTNRSPRPNGLAMTKPEYDDYLSIPPNYQLSYRAYIPIMTGCDNFCTYCAVPYTRGREKSRPAEEIIKEVRSLIKRGYKEITLLGQNVNSYAVNKKDIRQNTKGNQFAKLIKEIDKVPGDYRVYFYSNHPKDMSEELIETLSKLKHFPHYIHLPLQSGNNEILKKMNRHYTKKQYLDLVAKIKKAMPDVTLTTDIIVGFPGETEKEVTDTVNVMEKAKFDMAFLAQYSPRPGTVSAKMTDDVPKAEKVRREKISQQILAKTVLENNRKLVGKIVPVLIDEEKNGKLYGRTEGYKVVGISSKPRAQSPELKIGQFVNIKITKAESWKLLGLLV